MRLLLTFVFLTVMQSFVVCTQVDGSITFAQKSINELVSSKEIVKIFSTNSTNKFNKIQSSHIFKRLHHQITDYKLSIKNVINTKAKTLAYSLKSVKRIGSKVDYSYQYIFNCLYPKYSFW